MSEEFLHRLMRSVMETITRVQGSGVATDHERVAKRVLADLWSAHNELMLLGGPGSLTAAGEDTAFRQPRSRPPRGRR